MAKGPEKKHQKQGVTYQIAQSEKSKIARRKKRKSLAIKSFSDQNERPKKKRRIG